MIIDLGAGGDQAANRLRCEALWRLGRNSTVSEGEPATSEGLCYYYRSHGRSNVSYRLNFPLHDSGYYHYLQSGQRSLCSDGVMGYVIRGSNPGGEKFFSSAYRPHRLWVPPSLLFSGHRWLFARG